MVLRLGRRLVTWKGAHLGRNAALPEVCLDRRRQRGNLLILLHLDVWRMVWSCGPLRPLSWSW